MPAKKRELVEPKKGDKRYVRRDTAGQFGETDDVGRSSARDQKTKSKTASKRGQGDKGDRKPAGKSTRKAASTSRKTAGKSTRKAASKSTRKSGASKRGTRGR